MRVSKGKTQEHKTVMPLVVETRCLLPYLSASSCEGQFGLLREACCVFVGALVAPRTNLFS